VAGVVDVIALPDCLFVTASNLWSAKQGLAAAAPVWDEGANATVGQAQVIAAIEQAVQAPGVTAKAQGDLAAARAVRARARGDLSPALPCPCDDGAGQLHRPRNAAGRASLGRKPGADRRRAAAARVLGLAPKKCGSTIS
jgi:isoquinoline 1-oxidoreductase beta subunit